MTSLLSLLGCATIGANLALDLAKEEETKGCTASDPGDIRKVEVADCERISRLIKKAGIPEGFVGYDQSGRIKLKGTYQNEDQIDLAFMVAITVVGVNSLDISPVTPRDLQEIKMVSSNSYESTSNEVGNKYALLVGVSKFKQQLKPIVTAVRDVESIKQVLKKNGFKEENIILLTDKQATKSGILNAMHEFESKVTPKDSIVVYISTHGTSPDTFGKMGIIPYDLAMPFSIKNTGDGDMQSFAATIAKDESGDTKTIKIAKDRIEALKSAVSFDNLLDFFTGIKTDRFVAILDTCYSGAALNALTYPVGGSLYAEREKNYSQSQNTENKTILLGSGKACSNSTYDQALKVSKQIQTENECSFGGESKGLFVSDTSESNKLPNNISDYDYKNLENYRKVTGVSTGLQQGKAIITATSGKEKSIFDQQKLPNSFFTYYLVKGLEQSKGQIYPAFDYAQIRTQKLVSDAFNCHQTPEMVSTPGACVNLDLSQ